MIHFPPSPNSLTPMGERAHVSTCNHFRISESFMAHWRPAPSQAWQPVDIVPFASWAAAVAACERVAAREQLPRKRGQVLRALEHGLIEKRAERKARA